MLLVFAWRSACQYSMAEENAAAQRQTAVTAYFTSNQLLLLDFARRSACQYSMAEENRATQRQTAVAAYFTSEQLLLFVLTKLIWSTLDISNFSSNMSPSYFMAHFLKALKYFCINHEDQRVIFLIRNHYRCFSLLFYSYSVRFVFRRQILMFKVDPRADRIKNDPSLV